MNEGFDPSRAPKDDEPIYIDVEGQRARSKKWRTIRKTKRERHNHKTKAVRREEGLH